MEELASILSANEKQLSNSRAAAGFIRNLRKLALSGLLDLEHQRGVDFGFLPPGKTWYASARVLTT